MVSFQRNNLQLDNDEFRVDCQNFIVHNLSALQEWDILELHENRSRLIFCPTDCSQGHA